MKEKEKTISFIISAVVMAFVIALCVALVIQGSSKTPFSNDRFEIVQEQKNLYAASYIIADKETGVLYLWVQSGYAGGLTPLLDSNGEVVFRK